MSPPDTPSNTPPDTPRVPRADASSRPLARPARLLLPREHGAYGQLGLPLLAALLARSITLPAALLLIASLSFFVAHEPLLVVMGLRGPRARREGGRRARVWLGSLVLVGGLCTGLGALGSSSKTRAALVLPAGLALLVGGLIAARRERTLIGETVAACALASAGVPVMTAGGAEMSEALCAWLAWCVGFGAVTPAVRGVIAHHKAPTTVLFRLVSLAAPWGAWCVMVACRAPAATVVASLPLLVMASLLAFWPPHPRHLKRVGWVLVAASVATSATLTLWPLEANTEATVWGRGTLSHWPECRSYGSGDPMLATRVSVVWVRRVRAAPQRVVGTAHELRNALR